MKLSELIQKVGDENIAVQYMSDCVERIAMRKKGVTAITILTDQVTALEEMTNSSKKLGLIIWIPRALLADTKEGG